MWSMIWPLTRVGISLLSLSAGQIISSSTLDRDLLYSCSMEGEIKLWSVASSGSPASCLMMTALQTGPTGAGADMGAMGGLPASLEGELVTVRKIVFWGDKLYAADEMGGLCRWSSDLSTCELKKEYYTEIWSLALTDQGGWRTLASTAQYLNILPRSDSPHCQGQ